ncbi:MAG: hypothetical protein F4Z07_12850 [Dehalococcoidia bacterium]|nr:hypothetical protein [Dehalococcoidia bacterium]
MPEERGPAPTGRLSRLINRSPFQVLLITPILTLPLSAILLFALAGELDARALGLPEREYRSLIRGDPGTSVNFFYFDFWVVWLLLMLPGVVNLVPALWFLHRLAYVRVGAALALLVGALRSFLVPLLAVAIGSAEVISEPKLVLQIPLEESGLVLNPTGDLADVAKIRMLTTAWTAGLVMWLVTFGLYHGFEPLMARFAPNLEPLRKRQAGEPRSWGGFLDRR